MAHQNLRSPHCSTLVIHSTPLAIQIILAVDSFDSGVPQVEVCRGSTQKKGATPSQSSEVLALGMALQADIGGAQFGLHTVWPVAIYWIISSANLGSMAVRMSSYILLTK